MQLLWLCSFLSTLLPQATGSMIISTICTVCIIWICGELLSSHLYSFGCGLLSLRFPTWLDGHGGFSNTKLNLSSGSMERLMFASRWSRYETKSSLPFPCFYWVPSLRVQCRWLRNSYPRHSKRLLRFYSISSAPRSAFTTSIACFTRTYYIPPFTKNIMSLPPLSDWRQHTVQLRNMSFQTYCPTLSGHCLFLTTGLKRFSPSCSLSLAPSARIRGTIFQGCPRICNTTFIILLLMKTLAQRVFWMPFIARIRSLRGQWRKLGKGPEEITRRQEKLCWGTLPEWGSTNESNNIALWWLVVLNTLWRSLISQDQLI